VMETQNDYDREVFNGDLGTVSRIDEEEGALAVSFEGLTVETKRTRRYWVHPSPTPTASINLSSDDEPTPPFLGVIPPEGPVAEGREEALALAAQVFGEPVPAAPDPSDAMLADAPVLAEPLPGSRKPRVLPDLLATAREQSEAENATVR